LKVGGAGGGSYGASAGTGGSWSSSSKSGGSWSSSSSGGSTSWSVGGGKNKQSDTQEGKGVTVDTGKDGSTNEKDNGGPSGTIKAGSVGDGTLVKVDSNNAVGSPGGALSYKQADDGIANYQPNMVDGNKPANGEPTGINRAGTNRKPQTGVTDGHRGAGNVWKWGKKNGIKRHDSEQSKQNKNDRPKEVNGLKKTFTKEINGLKKTFKKLIQQQKRKSIKSKSR
jgi:hypothetical protein